MSRAVRSASLRRLAILGVGLAPLAACAPGGSANATSADASATTSTPSARYEDQPVLPARVDGADGRAVTVTDVSRIIPLNGDVAEVVFALGLGDRVVATDLSATYPAEADALPEIGYQRALAAEPILAHEPTVVIGDTMAGPPGVLDELRAVGVPLVIVDFPHDLAGPAAKIRAVARALGVPGRGECLAEEVQRSIDASAQQAEARVADAGGTMPRVVFLYLRGENVQQVAGRGSGVDALLRAAGALDIGTELGIDEFEPLTAESLVREAPDVIVVTTTGLESVGGIDGMVTLPAIAGTPAGRDRRVLALDDQLILGLGPRTGDALAQLVEGLHP